MDAFSDAEAYLKAAPYRKPVMINNLFDDEEDRDAVSDSQVDEKETQKKERQAPIELLEDRPYEGMAEEISGSKLYLLKLVEFNKIAILEKLGFGVKQATTLNMNN